MQNNTPTAGQLSAKAARDSQTYCGFEVADQMVKDVESQVFECARRHKDTFDTEEFCVVMLLASDCVLKNMIRRKFYAWPFLPKPRPSQTVWLYNKRTDTIRGLWCLPSADAMATLSLMISVDPAYQNMRRWSSWFYTTKFWNNIRHEAGIKMLSEEEHLQIASKKALKGTPDQFTPIPSNPVDAAKFHAKEISDA